MPNAQSGKGDSPRNNFSKRFQENYEKIKWRNKKAPEENATLIRSERILRKK